MHWIRRKFSGRSYWFDKQDEPILELYKWYSDSHGYLYTPKGPNADVVRYHRLILQPPSNMIVDHINRQVTDNRRCNLRIGTKSQNQGNIGLSRHNRSGFKGVGFDKANDRWHAKISINNKTQSLGRFLLKEDAARAYDKAALQYHGEFASLNFPGGVL